MRHKLHEKAVEPNGEANCTIEQLRSEYFGNLEEYGRLADMRSDVNRKFRQASESEARRMMEVAYVTAVPSIRTDTGQWERLVTDYLAGRTDVESLAKNTTDGQVKAEKLTHVRENTDILTMATRSAQHGFTEMAREYLIGRKTGDTDDTYVRATKANFVLWLLGFDTVCVDHRIHGVLRTTVPYVMDTTPETGADAKHKKVTEKPHAPTDVDFWHDTLKWDVESYDVLAGALVDYVADRTEIPADRVSQVAFNVAGEETRIHETLLGLLGA